MSWTASTIAPKSTVVDEINALVPSPSPLSAGPEAQFTAAKAAAIAVVESDSVGDGSDPQVTVRLVGHACEESAGNETVSIYLEAPSGGATAGRERP